MVDLDRLTTVTNFKSADEFIAALSAVGPRSPKLKQQMGFLYRGHSDDRWQLVPSSLRSGAFRGILDQGHVDPEQQQQQLHNELYIMTSFMIRADQMGLPIPEDSMAFREFIEGYRSRLLGSADLSDAVIWPPRNTHALLALARHAGLPTRLLDWTRNRWNAAYFAAVGAAESHYEKRTDGLELLSVWCAQASRFFRKVQMPRNVGSFLDLRIETSVEFFNVPNYFNRNAHAQGGWFSVVRTDHSILDAVDRRSLDEVLAQEIPDRCRLPIFQKLTLPAKEARDLLGRLAILGVDAGSVYPDYRGAADAVKENRLYLPE